MTSVLVVDDHDLMRSSLSRLIEAEADLVLAGTACNGWGGVELAQLLRPDVVLMDVALPDLDGIGATRELLRRAGVLWCVRRCGRAPAATSSRAIRPRH